MILSLEEVKHIAALARLELTADELERYRKQLSDILEYAARLQALDTQDISQASASLPGAGQMRSDQSRPGLEREDLFRNAPETEGGQFRVPPVLDAND